MMSKLMNRSMIAAALLIGGAGLLMVGQATARNNAAMFAPPAPVIALVDLPKVFEALDERKVREQELMDNANAKQAELTALGKELEEESTKAKMIGNVNQQQAAVIKLLEKQAMANAKRSAYDALLDQQRAEIFKALYMKVADTSKKLAEMQGYTMVMADDQGLNIPSGASTDAVRSVLGSRRILYAAKSHDITQDIINQLNIEFKNGKP
ncbi:MAG: OmpH family outer membrane protein [Phycisphaerales bacterium]|nr:OmpH family outer membrane protein [Phycisphaerales bacterium]